MGRSSKYWAYRVYWRHKGKVVARTEQFKTKKDAQVINDSMVWKGKVKKERKTRWQKKEEKTIKKLGVKGSHKRFSMEVMIPG